MLNVALDAVDLSSTTGADVPHTRKKIRATRKRTCQECGNVEEVRADNPALRCRLCSGRPTLEEGRFGRAARRNWETCLHCKRRFAAPPSNNQKYCSRACRADATSVERTCATCGSAFRIPRSILSGCSNSSGRFCSRPCYERYLCRTPRIRGRGSRWKAIRREALRRTPFCAACGARRHLQVHHIIPFRLTRDNSQTNLIPLCRACHKRVEALFQDIEAVDPPIPITKLVLFCSIHARRAVTLHTLKSLAHAAQHSAA